MIERKGDRRMSTVISCLQCGCRLETGETFDHGTAWNARADLYAARAAERDALREALASVREEICAGPVDDTLWHRSVPAETTVDFICNTLGDDWSYDEWLEARAALKGKTDE